MGKILHLFGLLFIIAEHQHISGEVITAVSDESVNIPLHETCTTKGKLVHWLENGTVTVASLNNGVWTPGEKYADRIEKSSSGILLSHINPNDSGVYQLTCGLRAPSYIKLEVLSFQSLWVPEGDPANLSCHFLTSDEPLKSVWWERNGMVVLKLNVSNGKIDYGPGYEGRASLSSDWKSKGDFSLILNRTQMEDSGDYSCFVSRNKKERGHPAIVRLTVDHKTNSSVPPPVKPSVRPVWSATSIAVCVLLLLAIPVAGLLGWKLKFYEHPVCWKRHQANDEEQPMSDTSTPTKGDHPESFKKEGEHKAPLVESTNGPN